MRRLPPTPRSVDPQLPKGRKKLFPTLLTSGVAILIVMFSMGQFPQVDAFLSQLNEIAREHNDEIVQLLIRLAPVGLFAFGAIGLTLIAVSSLRNRGKSAPTN